MRGREIEGERREEKRREERRGKYRRGRTIKRKEEEETDVTIDTWKRERERIE